MVRHGESSAGNGGKCKGKAPVSSLNRIVEANGAGPELLAMVNRLATTNIGNLVHDHQSKPLPPVPAGTPAPAPAPNESTTLVAQMHFAEVCRPQAFDHEVRQPPVVPETERRSNMNALTRLFKKRQKPKDPPSKPHAMSRNTGGVEEDSEKEGRAVGLQQSPGVNTQRDSLLTNATKKNSGTDVKPPGTVTPRQPPLPLPNGITPPERVMSPGISEEYVVAARTLCVPDVAPPQRAQTPIISRPRGRAYSAQYPEHY